MISPQEAMLFQSSHTKDEVALICEDIDVLLKVSLGQLIEGEKLEIDLNLVCSLRKDASVFYKGSNKKNVLLRIIELYRLVGWKVTGNLNSANEWTILVFHPSSLDNVGEI